jgi:quinol monooxygenase YgiN
MALRSFAVIAVAVAGCSSSSSSPSVPAAAGDGGPATPADAAGQPEVVAAALGVGALTADVATSQARHDQLVAGAEDRAKAAGDVGHTVMLGTSLLGTHENEFLALDRWRDATSLDAFYASPAYTAALATLFTGSPTLVKYVPATGWKQWGSLDAANAADPHYWVVVRGTLKSTDRAANQAAHDGGAAKIEPQATQLGDLGHIVFLGRDDPRRFLAFDVWKDIANIPTFYGNPDLVSAIAQVFEGAPTIGVYQSTKWHQW